MSAKGHMICPRNSLICVEHSNILGSFGSMFGSKGFLNEGRVVGAGSAWLLCSLFN